MDPIYLDHNAGAPLRPEALRTLVGSQRAALRQRLERPRLRRRGACGAVSRAQAGGEVSPAWRLRRSSSRAGRPSRITPFCVRWPRGAHVLLGTTEHPSLLEEVRGAARARRTRDRAAGRARRPPRTGALRGGARARHGARQRAGREPRDRASCSRWRSSRKSRRRAASPSTPTRRRPSGSSTLVARVAAGRLRLVLGAQARRTEGRGRAVRSARAHRSRRSCAAARRSAAGARARRTCRRIAGFGAACEAAARELADGSSARLGALRDSLWDGIARAMPDVVRNGGPQHVLPHVLDVLVPRRLGRGAGRGARPRGHRGLDGLRVSLRARPSRRPCCSRWGSRRALARAALRFSLGPGNDAAQIARVARASAAGWSRACAARGRA